MAMGVDLILYSNPMSRGRIARWMLEEVGQPYECVMLDYCTTMKAADYLAINPTGKVPALVHKGAVITECGAICHYLASSFPDAGLAPPPGSAASAAYHRWLYFAAGPIESATTAGALGFTVPEERKAMAGWSAVDVIADTLAAQLEKHLYLAGDRFSAADVYTGSQIGWAMQFNSLPKRDAFGPYLERIMSRPAAVRANALDDALMPTVA
jgi:glutathione S-transferase